MWTLIYYLSQLFKLYTLPDHMPFEHEREEFNPNPEAFEGVGGTLLRQSEVLFKLG